MDCIHRYTSPLGVITIAGSGDAVVGLWFDGQKHFGEALDPDHTEKYLPVFGRAEQWLDLYFSGKEPDFLPVLRLRGTPFRKSVWEILLSIPYGHTMTYGQIAGMIAQRTGAGRMSAQAVGSAVGHNPVSLMVPCHRVIGTDGSLTGYAGGIDKKIRLLQLEQADTGNFRVP